MVNQGAAFEHGSKVVHWDSCIFTTLIYRTILLLSTCRGTLRHQYCFISGVQ